MGPKGRAACEFVERTGKIAAIGSIGDTAALVSGEAGTIVTLEAAGLETAGARRGERQRPPLAGRRIFGGTVQCRHAVPGSAVPSKPRNAAAPFFSSSRSSS